MNSLERSLQLWLVGALVILMFIFWWSVTLTSRTLTESQLYTRLEQQVYDIQSARTNGTDEGRAFMNRLAVSYPLRVFLVAQQEGVFQAGISPATGQDDISVLVPDLAPGQSLRTSHTVDNGRSMLGWYGGFNSENGPFVLGALQDVAPIKSRLAIFHWFSAIFALVVLAIVFWVQHRILRRSVEKVESIRRDLLRLEHGQAVALSEDLPTEILPLVTEFNQLLRRFEQRLRQSRNAVGNLAHSVKGPLNLLMRSTEAEVIGTTEKEAIVHNVEHIRRLIESELKRARLAGRGTVGIRFDANIELPPIIGLLEQVYPEKASAVSFTVDKHLELVHDRQDMLELIGNLLDNAVKWCDSRVVLSLQAADGVMMTVEDDGPGCSPELLGRLTDRGVRLDETVAGHGLGLSIVKDIVDTYDGRMSLEPSVQFGGLKVTVYLPHRR